MSCRLRCWVEGGGKRGGAAGVKAKLANEWDVNDTLHDFASGWASRSGKARQGPGISKTSRPRDGKNTSYGDSESNIWSRHEVWTMLSPYYLTYLLAALRFCWKTDGPISTLREP